MRNCSEDVGDFTGEIKVAMDTGPPEAALAASRDRQRAWLGRKRSRPGTRGWVPRKRHRVATSKFCWSTEHQLELSNLSFNDLRLPDEPADRPPPKDWKRGSMAVDQGSDGVCAGNYLMRGLNLVLDCTYDISHGVHRDVICMLKQCGLWVWATLMLVAFNVPTGPYAEDQRYKQCKEGIDLLYNRTSPADIPLFEANLQGMVDDMGNKDILAVEDPGMEVWEDCKADNPWKTRGDKILMNRFLGFIYKLSSEIRMFSKRGFHYQFVCIEENMLAGTKFEKLAMANSAAMHEAGLGSTDARRPGLDDRAMRSSCQHAMVIAMVMYSDNENKVKGRALMTVVAAVLEWFKEQARTLKGASSSVPWMLDQVSCKFFLTLCSVMMVLQSDIALVYVGLTTEFSDARAPLTPEELIFEDYIAGLLARMAFSLVSARLRRCSWMYRGWPGRSILWTSAKEEESRGACALFMDDLRRFQAWLAKQDRVAGLKEVVARSVFHKMVVQQDAGALSSNGGEPTDEVRSYATANHTRVISTVPCEDAFHFQKNNTSVQANRIQRIERAYGTLLYRNVLAVHPEFQAVQPLSVGSIRAGVLHPQAFKQGVVENPPLDFNRVIGYNQKTEWYSPGQENLCAQDFDLELARYCQQWDCDNLVRHAWLGCFIQSEHNLMVREHRGDFYSEWKFALAPAKGSASLVWPAQEFAATNVEGGSCFRPTCDNQSIEEYFMPVLDLDVVEACTISWQSPARQHANNVEVAGPPGIVAVVTSGPKPLFNNRCGSSFLDVHPCSH